MIEVVRELRKLAAGLLENKEVDLIIGYGEGSELTRTTPVFITSPGEVEKLTWGPFCVNNLAKYLLDYHQLPGKVAVVVKGCDSRAVNRLVSDNQVERNKIVVLGISCPGQLDCRQAAGVTDPAARLGEAVDRGEEFLLRTDRGEFSLSKRDFLLPKCRTCENPVPVTADICLGDGRPPEAEAGRFDEVRALEDLATAEKSAYWDRQFSRCLRCYACRNVCPACTCRQCVFDQAEPAWVSKRNNLSENTAFHLIRAFHVAGRCVDCGECDRVCPVGIPLQKLNRKVLKDLAELFEAPTPGSRAGLESALGGFATGDPEEFM